VSKRQAELLAKALPKIRGKLKIVYNPPPPISQINKEIVNEPLFIYLGGESYLKGFYILLEAVARFLKKGGRAKFIFTNNYSIKCISRITSLNRLYGNAIQLTGRIPYTELMPIYQKAWALIFPSIWEEPLPYAIIESLMTQTIPLSSKVGGVSELVESTELEKFLFNPGNSEELYERLLTVSTMTKKDVLSLTQHVNKVYHHLSHTILNKDNIMKAFLQILS
jgi:glycosyltransferase involved in cell wall biosynthesis